MKLQQEIMQKMKRAAEILLLKGKISTLEKHNEILNDEISTRNTTIEELNAYIKEKDAYIVKSDGIKTQLIKDLEDATNKINDLEDELASLNRDYDEAYKELQELRFRNPYLE